MACRRPVLAQTFAEIAEVNVVPLADVSLVLLILLMVLSPMMTQSMLSVRAAAQADPGARPPEREMPPAPPELVLVVTILPDRVAVGERSFAGMGSFTAFIAAELARRSDRKVFLVPHPDTANGKVVHMLETLKDCGASSVALVQSAPQARAQGGE